MDFRDWLVFLSLPFLIKIENYQLTIDNCQLKIERGNSWF